MNLGLLRFIDAACQAYSHVTRIILNRASAGGYSRKLTRPAQPTSNSRGLTLHSLPPSNTITLIPLLYSLRLYYPRQRQVAILPLIALSRACRQSHSSFEPLRTIMADDSLAATTAQDTHDSFTGEEGGADAHADAPEVQIEQGTLCSSAFTLLYILCDLLCFDPPSMPVTPLLVSLWIQPPWIHRPPISLLVRTLNFRV